MQAAGALPAILARAAALTQPRLGYRFGPENLLLPDLLAAFPHSAPGSLLDLGAGCGILGLLASWTTGAPCTLVERNSELLEHLQHNVAEAGDASRVLAGDLRQLPLPMADIVIANPPFFRVGEGMRSRHETIRDATHAHHGDLVDFLLAGAKRLLPDGHLWLLYPSDRMAQVVDAALSADLVPTVICSVHARHTGKSYRTWVRLQAQPQPTRYLALSMHTER